MTAMVVVQLGAQMPHFSSVIDTTGDIMTPKAKSHKREYDKAYIQRLRKNPKFRAKERVANMLRMRRYREAKRRGADGT